MTARTKIAFMTGDIRIENEGYKNLIIDERNGEVMEEIADTFEGAVHFVMNHYNAILIG